MADSFNDSKTALELALELGVRAETVLNAMKEAGIDADDPMAEIDTVLEDRLVEQMVDSGALPQSVQKGKGRRQLSDDPIVDDDAVNAALGASREGYSESNIPRQIALESSFDKPPSFFQRMFSKPKNLARTLKNNDYTPDELNSFFTESSTKDRSTSSPFEEREPQSQDGQDDDQAALDGDEDLFPDELQAIDDYVPEEEGSDEDDGIDVDIADEAGLEDMDLDPEMMDDLDDVDLGDADLDSELSDLSDELGLDSSDLESEPSDDEDDVELEGLDEAIDDIDLDDEDLEIPDDEEGEEGESDELSDEEEEYAPGYLERILSRIHLSQTETLALMGGSLSIMLLVLGLTAYWWMYNSPRAQEDLFTSAMEHYSEANNIADDTNYKRPELEMWKDRAAELEAATADFRKFIQQFPQNPLVGDAFENLSDITYELAQLYEANAGESETDPVADKAEETYRKVTQLYGQYLDFLDEQAIAASTVGVTGAAQFADVEKQKDALWRIALSQQKLQRWNEAVDKFEEFARRFGNSPEAIEAIRQTGNIYTEWAKLDKENEPELLQEAMQRYRRALNNTPDHQHLTRSELYSDMGDIEYRLYERSQQQEKAEQADAHLRESIAYYERAEEEARQVDGLSNRQKIDIFKPLADMYLQRGRAAGDLWSRNEESARLFPEGIAYRKTLEDEAERQRERTLEFLNKANALYDDMLAETNDKELLEDILYNKTESLFIMREYPEAKQAGEMLLEIGDDLTPDIRIKINYLLGHIAWEMARQTDDYSDVKKYYREALSLNPFYPQESQGEISHLSTLRLTNAFFIVDKRYEDALKRYRNATLNYPSTDYTYLTHYWYGKALDEYGHDWLARDEETNTPRPDETENAEEQESKTSNDYPDYGTPAKVFEDAVQVYNRAIETREDSKYVDVQNKSYLIEMMFNRGHSAFFAENYREAEKYLQQAIDEFGDAPPAKKEIPGAIERMGDINALLADYDRAIGHYLDYLNEAYPDPNARIRMKLADAYLQKLAEDDARQWYRRIVRDFGLPRQKGPGFEALKKIARSHIQEAALKLDEDSVNELQQSLQVFDELAQAYPLPANPDLPDDAESLQAIGNIQYRLRNYPDSIEAYKAYLNTADPQRVGMINYRIGQAHLDMNQPDQAIDALSNITERSMDNMEQYADTLLLLGDAYQERAKQFNQAGDDGLYETYLRRAADAYERVSVTGETEKIQKAQVQRQLINSILVRLREQRQQELAQTGAGAP